MAEAERTGKYLQRVLKGSVRLLAFTPKREPH